MASMENDLKTMLDSLPEKELDLTVGLRFKVGGKERTITRLEKINKSWKGFEKDGKKYTLSAFPRIIQLQFAFLINAQTNGVEWKQTMVCHSEKMIF